MILLWMLWSFAELQTIPVTALWIPKWRLLSYGCTLIYQVPVVSKETIKLHNHRAVLKQVCLIRAVHTPHAERIFLPNFHTGRQEMHVLTEQPAYICIRCPKQRLLYYTESQQWLMLPFLPSPHRVSVIFHIHSLRWNSLCSLLKLGLGWRTLGWFWLVISSSTAPFNNLLLLC